MRCLTPLVLLVALGCSAVPAPDPYVPRDAGPDVPMCYVLHPGEPGGLGVLCDGGCLAIDDPAHCGSCGNRCSADMLCVQGGNAFHCVTPTH